MYSVYCLDQLRFASTLAPKGYCSIRGNTSQNTEKTAIQTFQDVKEGELSVGLILHHELYAGVDTVQMLVEGVNQVQRKCCTCVDDISSPKPWGAVVGR